MEVTASLFLMVLLLTVSSSSSSTYAQLLVGFYDVNDCPMAERIVKDVVSNAVKQDFSMAASLLRLHFHDCFVRGCDASILLDPQTGFQSPEKLSLPNLSVRGYKVIDAAKEALEKACPNTVSCADIVALAARDAVVLAGGSNWPVPTGRRDGRISSNNEAFNNLPSSFANAQQLTQQFLNLGLTQDEMITLSGAHTIGRAHCVAFIRRLYNFSSAYETDPALNPSYAIKLKQLCPLNFNPRTVVPLDPTTPQLFDNMYYTNLQNGMGLMVSDDTIQTDMLTQPATEINTLDADMWQTKFGDAMVHMGSLNIKTGLEGILQLFGLLPYSIKLLQYHYPEEYDCFKTFNALGEIAFAYGGHNVALEIQATMRPSKIPMCLLPMLW